VRTLEDYRRELAKALPSRYLETEDFKTYEKELVLARGGTIGAEAGAGFRV
jgi:hypothetical protein